MNVTIKPSRLKGNIQAPASKSSMQRACAAALLTKGIHKIRNFGQSNDDKAAIDIIQRLGADVREENDELIVESDGVNPRNNSINCGESGLSIRMFTPLAALSKKEILIEGSGSLVNRPMDFFDKIFPELSVTIQSQAGKLPLKVKGPLVPTNIEVDGSLSSQFLTGLLMAYAASLDSSAKKNDPVSISVRNLKSKPYIDLTLDVMRQFGMRVPENRNYEIFHFPSLERERKHGFTEYTVEGDWSGAAFLLVAGVIAGPVLVSGLDLGSTQADRAVMDALVAAGAAIATEAKGIRVQPSALYSFEFDATDCPDLFPPLVALAAYCGGKSHIKGVSRLSHKESNRAVTLQEEFGKMGVLIEWDDDHMLIHGGQGVKGATVFSNHDHRIAMSTAIAALAADGETIIESADAVRKSYPGFFNDLQALGASVSLPYNHLGIKN